MAARFLRLAATRRLPSLAGLLLLANGCGPSGPPRDVNLLIVSIDTLRADRLGCYGNDEWGESPSPRLDALAAESVLFESAYASRGQTHPSLASMLTGKYPITTGVRENGMPLSAEHKTLFEHLAAAGFQTGVFIANFEVDHPRENWIARGADVSGDGVEGMRTQQMSLPESALQAGWDDNVEKSALAYLHGVDPSRPFALWVHYYDVHQPYNPPPAVAQRYGIVPGIPQAIVAPGPNSAGVLDAYLGGITLGEHEATEAELARIRGLYDANVRTADERFGRLLDALQELGELENTYVVFTADHGEELYDHNRYFYHGGSVYNGVITLPLVIHGPDLLAGVRVSDVVRNIDITPTLLDLLELPADASMEGVSLAGRLRGEVPVAPVTHAVTEWQDLVYAVSDGRFKLIYNPRHVYTRKIPWHGRDVPKPLGFRIDCLEGYDLTADPSEQHNLLAGVALSTLENGAGLPPAFQPLYEHLTRFLADPRHQAKFRASLDEAARERQAQLSYVDAVNPQRNDSVQQEPCR